MGSVASHEVKCWYPPVIKPGWGIHKLNWQTYLYLFIYIYIWSRPPSLHPPSPSRPWVGSPGSSPNSLLFASYWQHFWLPASHLLGTCYLLGDLRTTHTPSKYLRATYSHLSIHVLCIYCIYFLFTTCVLWQHYLCLTYTVPTIHVKDAMHTIPIISIIHTISTIHTIPTTHAIPDRPYTPYIPNMPYHTPTTPQGGRGTVPHPHRTTGGGGGRSHMGPVYGTHGGGVAGPGAYMWENHRLAWEIYQLTRSQKINQFQIQRRARGIQTESVFFPKRTWLV